MKALITGSFDPVTNGHLDLIKRAAAVFDDVTVGIFINPDKSYTFPEQTRLSMMVEAIKNIKNARAVLSHGMVADYCRENGINVIVKGVRNANDFLYECNMARYNREHCPTTETVLLPASDEFVSISSTAIRELFKKGDDISGYVPSVVIKEFNNLK
jgi:pantetheine-phosphate adenylyltransferase